MMYIGEREVSGVEWKIQKANNVNPYCFLVEELPIWLLE